MAYEYPAVEEAEAPDYEVGEGSLTAEKSRSRSTPRRQTMLDDIAEDLALWIDDTASKIALAFAPGRAPFSAQITEQQKLEFYKAQLFNPDGSPNQAGRQAQIQRLGTENFAAVYKAVVAAYPELKPPPPAPIEVPEQWPGPPGPPQLGPGPGPIPVGPAPPPMLPMSGGP